MLTYFINLKAGGQVAQVVIVEQVVAVNLHKQTLALKLLFQI